MAKKRTSARKPKAPPGRDKQTHIPGTVQELPEDVQEAVDRYVDKLRERQRVQAKENDLRAECRLLMIDHKIRSVDIDDGEKALVLEPGEAKLRIKKKDKA